MDKPTSTNGSATDEALLRSLETSQLYSEELGIDLSAGCDREYFKWFLASILFGGRLSATIAKKTYAVMLRHNLIAPEMIVRAGWDFAVDPVVREGGYVTGHGFKSAQLVRNSDKLLREYGGSLKSLHDEASDASDLETRLTLFYGIGPVTANIFLRELRPYLEKADPEPLPTASEAAHELGIDFTHYARKSIEFARVEAGLLRRRSHMTRSGLARPERKPH